MRVTAQTRKVSIGRIAVAGTLCALLAGGCSILPKTENQTVYALPEAKSAGPSSATRHPGAATGGHSWSLRVKTPYSNRMIGGSRILVWPDEGEIRVYKDVRWSDTAPVMMRDRLVEALRSDGRLAAVSNDSSHLAADLELGADLNSFQVEYIDGAPTVHIGLDVFLVEPVGSRVRATQRFDVMQAVNGKEVPEVVDAFGKAADQIAASIVDWVMDHGPASPGTDTARSRLRR